MKMALLCALRGNIILYKGEELGLGQVEIPFELVKDPEARKNWPLTLSRDGARTPLPWAAEAAHAGFRSEEHTSELQSLMRNSYAVFCLKKKKNTTRDNVRKNTHILTIQKEHNYIKSL